MTFQFYDVVLVWRGSDTGQQMRVAVDWDDPEATDAKLAAVMCGAIRRDGGGPRDLADYVLEMHDGDPDTDTVVFATDEWVEG